jgi:alanine dehydrogenase
MIVGIPKEVRDMETRVALTPAGVNSLVQNGHTAFVQSGAGEGSGYSDEAYRQVGANIVYSAAEAYGRADLVVKVARPAAQEHRLFRPNQAVMAFYSLGSASADLTDALLQHAITAISLELIEERDGSRPVLLPASEIAGRLAPFIAGSLMMSATGRGVLLSGLPGIPPASVVILGAGTLGINAARAFLGVGAEVIVLDRDVSRLRHLEQAVGERITTMFSSKYNIDFAVGFADVILGAVSVPGARPPVLLRRDHIRRMRPGSVLIDMAVDEGGCAETTRPTTLRHPTYVVDDVIHYCVPNVTAAVARTTSRAISNALIPYLLAFGEAEISADSPQTAPLRHGVLTHNGHLIHPGIAAALGRSATATLSTGA